MDEIEFRKLIECQQEIHRHKVIYDFRKTIEDEFVMNHMLKRLLDYYESRRFGVLNKEEWDKNFSNIGILTKKLKDFDIGRHLKEQKMYLHRHTYMEIDYVYKGECRYYIGEEGTSFLLKEKEMCMVNQKAIHGLECNEDSIVIKIMIPFSFVDINDYDEVMDMSPIREFLSKAFEEDKVQGAYQVYQIKEHIYFEELIYQILEEYINKETGWRQVVKNKLSSLFIGLVRYESDSLKIFEIMEDEDLNIAKVVTYIRKNYPYITLGDLARDLHYNENYLSRLIKRTTQKTFSQLRMEIRMEAAKKLLETTDLPISVISQRIGYEKPNHFYRTFKKFYGFTPSVLR